MTRFNTSTVGKTKTVNRAGGDSYKIGSEMELYTLVCTTTLTNKFYETADSQLTRIRNLVRECNPGFVARLAVYAREKMYLRTIPLVLTAELNKLNRGYNLVSRALARVIQRPDEITEAVGYYIQANGIKPKRNADGTMKKLYKISGQYRKGLAAAFRKFDEYGFSKYNRDSEIRLRDVMFLARPKPENEEQASLFKKIANKQLSKPDTWEVKMSEAGKADTTPTSKKTVWEEMIDSKKMGYMATLRNLRNFLSSGVSKGHMMKVCEYLSNEKAVLNSKQFPFRFLSAYRMLKGEPARISYRSNLDTVDVSSSPFLNMVLEALEQAVTHSIKNIPMFEDETVLIASDVSGSMFDPISEKSIVRQYDIGLLLSMLLHNRCEMVTTGIFGNTWMPLPMHGKKVLQKVNEMYATEGKVGYSTHGYRVLEWANKQGTEYDRIMMFTDCQLYGGPSIQKEWNKYKKKFPNAKLYLFDLSGHGSSPLSIQDNDVNLIAGWSDKVFEIMANIENGGKVLDEIKKIEL